MSISAPELSVSQDHVYTLWLVKVGRIACATAAPYANDSLHHYHVAGLHNNRYIPYGFICFLQFLCDPIQ